MSKFNIGDVIKVIDVAQSYTTYLNGQGEWMSREDAGYLNIVKYKDGELVYG